MPCYFCMLVGGIVAAGLASANLARIVEQLATVARDGVQETQRSASAVVFELAVPVPRLAGERGMAGRPPEAAPVAVTVYPKARRVRVQVLTHDVTRREAEAIEDAVGAALGMTVAHRSGEAEQHLVHDATAQMTETSDASGTPATRQAWEQEGR